MEQDQLTWELVTAVEQSNLPSKDKIAQIMRMSAARDLTLMYLREKNRPSAGG